MLTELVPSTVKEVVPGEVVNPTLVAGTLILNEFGERVVVVTAPDVTNDAFDTVDGGILMLTELVPKEVTEAVPATLVTCTLLVGTLMLNEFAPNVAVFTAPDVTNDAFDTVDG